MRYIYLTQGYKAIVDDSDFELLNKFKWYFDHGYAARREKQAGRRKVYMHRQLLGLDTDMLCDHINRNGLDNRESNLRACTPSQNQANRKKTRTDFKGIWFNKRDKLYQARIVVNRKVLSLGSSKDPQEAHRIYMDAAELYFGEFARSE